MEINLSLQDWMNQTNNLSRSDKLHILTTQYIIKLSHLDNETFMKVCDSNNIKYPALRAIQDQGKSFPDITSIFNRYELQNNLVEKFKSCVGKLNLYHKPALMTLFSKNFQLIKHHINFAPNLVDEYMYAILITNVFSLTKFIDGDD
jgi:hypothetical protein